MKVRYIAGPGSCSGEADEVVLIPEDALQHLSREEAMTDLISSFGCRECVEYDPVPDDTPHQREVYWDDKWGQLFFKNEWDEKEYQEL